MKYTTIAFGLVSIAVGQTVCAIPVPAYDSTALLSAANTVFVGQILKEEPGAAEGQVSLVVRADKLIKGRGDIQLANLVTLSTEGPQVTSLSAGTKGIFVLNCTGSECRPLDSFRPYWPAVETGDLLPGVQGADGVSAAVLAELVAVIGASDTALAASTGEGTLSPDQAEQLRSVAIAAIYTLPKPAALSALHALGRPSDTKTRLAISAAEVRLGDTSGLQDITEAMVDTKTEFAAARREVASQGMGLTDVPASLAPIFAAWLKSPDSQVRITAAYCLRIIHAPSVIEPLLTFGINDSEKWVRYYSAGGLARATGEGHVPSIEIFFAQEPTYIGYWKSRQAKLLSALKSQPLNTDNSN